MAPRGSELLERAGMPVVDVEEFEPHPRDPYLRGLDLPYFEASGGLSLSAEFLAAWRNACRAQVPLARSSAYRRWHVAGLYDLIHDDQAIAELLDEALAGRE